MLFTSLIANILSKIVFRFATLTEEEFFLATVPTNPMKATKFGFCHYFPGIFCLTFILKIMP